MAGQPPKPADIVYSMTPTVAAARGLHPMYTGMACLAGNGGTDDMQNAPIVIDAGDEAKYWTDGQHTAFTAFAVTILTNDLAAIMKGVHRGAALVALYNMACQPSTEDRNGVTEKNFMDGVKAVIGKALEPTWRPRA